jgi:hypothetical protein
VGKFHVGDRWADQVGREWLVVRTHGPLWRAVLQGPWEYTCALFNSEGLSSGDGSVCLTRLISSERWIPFEEMMPEPPVKGDQRKFLALPDWDAEDVDIIDVYEASGKTWRDRHSIPLNLDAPQSDYTHWRYIQPPEAS